MNKRKSPGYRVTVNCFNPITPGVHKMVKHGAFDHFVDTRRYMFNLEIVIDQSVLVFIESPVPHRYTGEYQVTGQKLPSHCAKYTDYLTKQKIMVSCLKVEAV